MENGRTCHGIGGLVRGMLVSGIPLTQEGKRKFVPHAPVLL
jgi:hypothetical protein